MKRAISILLTLCMLFTLLPFGALAAEDEPGAAEDVVYLDDETIASLQEDDAEPVEASSDAATPLSVTEDDPPAVTRAKWLADLVDAYALAAEVADEALPDNYYPDLAEDHEFYRDILVAVHFGLVDVEPGYELAPDAALTRGFAAFSLNQLAGYLKQAENYTFTDADDVAYPDAAQVAVEHGWLALSGGKFLPEQAVTEAEAAVMVQAAQDAYAATQIDESHENSIVFNPNVKVVPQGTPADEPQLGTVTITNCPIGILAGDTVAVYITDIPSVYQVETVSVDGETTTITGTPVALSDAVVSMDLQGSFDVPLEYASPLEDSDLYYILDSGSQTKSRALAKANSVRLKEIKGSKTIDLGSGVKLKVSFTMPAPVVDYSINPASPMVILRDSNASATVTLSKNFVEGMGIPSQVMLVGYKVPGVGSIGVYAYLKIDGSVTLTVTGNLKAGVSYSGGHLSAPMSFNRTSSTITAEATVDAGFKAELSVTLLGKKILHGDVYARFGGAMNVRAVVRDAGVTPHYCVGTKQWIYADAGYNVTVLLKSYSDSMQLLDLSAYQVVSHFEDGARVPHCTLDDNFDNYITPPGSRNYNNGGWGGWNGTSYNAAWEPVEVYKYTTDENGNATITGFYGNVSALTIPDQIDGHTVVAIANNAFKGLSQIRTVIMPDTITEIGYSAFENCVNLGNISLSSSLKYIGAFAFRNCSSLTDIMIPKSLEGTDEGYGDGYHGPFYGCTSLKTAEFEEGTTAIAYNIFWGASALESVIIPDTVTNIGYCAFQDCSSLKKVTLPKNLSTIGSKAFWNCSSITNVVIPKTLEGANDGYGNGYHGPFYGCTSLKTAEFEEGTTAIAYNIFWGASALESVIIPDTVTNIGYCAFQDCSSLKKVTLPKYLSTIGSKAFWNCSSITNVVVPKTLEGANDGYGNGYHGPFYGCTSLKTAEFEEGTTAITYNIFWGASALESVIIPDAVTLIGSSAFRDCTSLKSVELPKFLTKINASAFWNCNSLSEIIIPKTLQNVETGYSGGYIGPFARCTGLKTIVFEKGTKTVIDNIFNDAGFGENAEVQIPESVTVIGSNAFYQTENLNSIQFPKNLTEIRDYAFASSGLISINIPDNTISIGKGAFQNCVSIKDIKLSNQCNYISENMFLNDTLIEEITLPDAVTNIYASAFRNCTTLRKINWSKSVVTLGDRAFENTGFTQLALSDTITSIGSEVFSNCALLTSVQMSNHLTSIGHGVFENCDSLSDVSIPSSIKSIGSRTFYDCDGLVTIQLPNSITSWGTETFYDCDALKNVTLGTGLKSIPNSTFEHCDVLEKVVVPYQVTSIGTNAFKDCVKFTEITIPRATTSIQTNAVSYADILTIYGVAGTTAETYANDIGATFVAIDKPMQSITLSASELTVNRGATVQLIPSFTPADFTDEVMWKSSNTSIATVDQDGNVKAVSVGTATISLVGGDCRATCRVTVIQPVTGISLNKTSLSLEGGETFALTATVNPSNAANKEIAWSSSDETIAAVTSDGVVTALKKGTATITCAAQDGSGVKATCTVTVTNDLNIVTSVKDLQSPHKYANNCNDLWQYTQEGRDSLTVTFSDRTSVEEGSDFIYIYDKNGNQVGKYTGSELAGQTITVPGDTVRIKLVSDGVYAEYGFAVTQVNDVYAATPLVITQQPQDFTGNMGDAATFFIAATGDDLAWQWQYKDAGGSWINADSTAASISVTLSADLNGRQYRCIVTDAYGSSLTSDAATLTVNTPVLENPFTDVAKGKFYYDAVLWAISQDPQITTGVTDTTFMPDRTCTRAHVVTFLWRANGCPEPTSTTNTFKDVPNGKYYTKAVLWAAEQGITTGYSDGTFRPDDECSRGQVVTFLWRAKGQPAPSSMSNPFSDVPAGKYYTTAVLWALENNITKGRTATTFGPDDACTRGHVVTFLYRAYA